MMTMVCLVALLAGCRGDRGRNADDTLPPPRPTTTTTAPSYDVPAVIDEAYVARVMQALDHVYGDAVRLLATTRQVNEDFLRYLVAIYTDRYYRLAQDAWVKDVARGLPRLAVKPDDPGTVVERLVRASADCVVAQVGRDFGPTTNGPPDVTPQRYVALVPKPPNRDPQGLNPTPWAMSYDGFTTSGAEPEEPCRG